MPAARSATEAQAAIRAMKSAKKDNIIDGVQMRKTGIPCTQQGLFWSDHVAAASAKSKAEQAQEAAKQEQAAADKQREKEAKAMARQRNTEDVLALLQAQSDNWHTLGAQQLVDAANDLLKPNPAVKTKAAAVPLLRDAIAAGRFATVAA